MSIADNLQQIRNSINDAALLCGRSGKDVRLVTVSKTRPAADISAAYAAGQTIFGENYVQELCSKATEVQEPVDWHFIGHLQSNKVKYIADIVSTIHSVDRLSLAKEINRQWGQRGKICNILIQGNISGEETKTGTSGDQALELVREAAKLPNIRIMGLMTMPPFFDDPDAARPYFSALRQLFGQIRAAGIPGVEMNALSMGMSGDFEVAIQEGATLVRVGTAIFGQR